MAGQTQPNLQPVLAELIDAWNAHDAVRVASYYDPDYVGIDAAEAGQQRGPAGVRQTVQRYLNAFPDLTLAQEQAVLCDNHAAIELTVRGTHLGSLMHIPPTGRPAHIQGVAFLTFEEARIIQASYLWDIAGFLRNIGLLPDL